MKLAPLHFVANLINLMFREMKPNNSPENRRRLNQEHEEDSHQSLDTSKYFQIENNLKRDTKMNVMQNTLFN